jgi:hypothetical protein
MRDIELLPAGDAAYALPQPGGLPASTTLTDPAFTDAKAYGKPSLGGEFGPGHAALLSSTYVDGGEAALGEDIVYVAPPAPVATPAYALAGRSANNSSFLNLFPWFKTPKEGLDMNNPNPPPAPSPAPSPPPPPATAHGISMPVLQLVSNQGTVQFSGPAQTDATITIAYTTGGVSGTFTVPIVSGDTASQIAAKVRNEVDSFVGLDASGTGGTVNVIGIGGVLTAFNVTIS